MGRYDCTMDVIEPLGSYTFTVSVNSGSECKISFDILENAPWLIVDGNTCIKQGISLGSDKFIHSLNSENYEPLSDQFTGLGYLPGEYHIEINPDIRPAQHTPDVCQCHSKQNLRKRLMRWKRKGSSSKKPSRETG